MSQPFDLAVAAYNVAFNEGPYSSMRMVDFVLSKAGKSHSDVLSDPKCAALKETAFANDSIDTMRPV